MTNGHGSDYKDLVVFLAAAGVMVPLVNRLKISPILGFLAAGVLLGPDGLARFADTLPWLSWATISDPGQLGQLSELGVAFLLFMIGLELSWERLRAMRRLVFGLGLMQVAACTAVLAGLFMLTGQTLASAAVLGMGLALSSTAVVMPVLAERGRLKGAVGRSTFAVLLAQDLAVAPILITVTVLAALAQGGDVLDTAVLGRALLTLVPAAIGLGALVLLGRVVLRPMFRSVARARKVDQGGELFVAASLLVVIGAGLAAQASGLSMSIGALIAGVLLAETEFRREVEVAIEPFKGLLLGVFFVGVGLGLDLDAVAANPLGVVGLAIAITVVKAVIVFSLARLWGLSGRTALETALVLAPAGEFAFVVFATGLVEGIASPAVTATVTLSATISIFSIPLLALIGQKLTARGAGDAAPSEVETANPDLHEGGTVIVGFGRVGRLIGEMLREHGQPFIAVDTDPAAVAVGRREGFDVFYGDAGRVEMLMKCGVMSTRALVVTMDAPEGVEAIVATTVGGERHSDGHHTQRQQRIDAAPTPGDDPLRSFRDHCLAEGVPDGDREGLRQRRSGGKQQRKRNEKSAKHEMPPAS